MRVKRFILIPVFCLLAATSLLTADEHKTHGDAAASITVDELRDHMFFLASDTLQGRMSGTAGFDLAAGYAASQFQGSGLLPAFKDEQGNPTYYQKFFLKRTYKSEKSNLTLTRDGKTTAYRITDDFGLMYFGKSLGEIAPAGVAFVGYGIQEPASNWDDYAGVDVKGKYVIMVMGTPKKEDGTPVLPEAIDKKYSDRRMSIMPRFMTLKKMGAIGLIVVPAPELGDSWRGMYNFVTRPRLSIWKEGAPEFNNLAFLDLPIVLVQPDLANAIIAGQPYNPMTHEGTYKSFVLEGVSLGMVVDIAEDKVETFNIGGIVPGTDAALKDEYITIGGHIDHEGVNGGQVYNGADDNASGSCAVIEAAEAAAMTPARRSTMFILYAGEELGLLGSKYFADNSPVPVANIVVNINMDMVGRDDKDFPQGVYVLGSDKRSAELKELLIQTDDAGVKLPLDFRYDKSDPESWWTRSDQFSFHAKGVPVIFFTSGDHPDYHTPADDPEKIDFPKLRMVSQLCYEMAMTLGNRDARPAPNSK